MWLNYHKSTVTTEPNFSSSSNLDGQNENALSQERDRVSSLKFSDVPSSPPFCRVLSMVLPDYVGERYPLP